MNTTAVVLSKPKELHLAGLDLIEEGPDDAVVDVHWTGISTGTEKLLYEGKMPQFPGMGYPLVPGYEAVGTVAAAGATSGRKVGERVFVPGTQGFVGARGLFGAAASRLVVSGERVTPVPESLGESAILLALAATAHHALTLPGSGPPGLIIGHGTLGRLLARISIALGFPAPNVWELDPERRAGEFDYPVMESESDASRTYDTIIDASGASSILDQLIGRLAPRGEIILAGFYNERLSFSFPPAFMREARISIAAEFHPADVRAVLSMLTDKVLSFEALITHSDQAANAPDAYERAFNDPQCLKMVLDWRSLS